MLWPVYYLAFETNAVEPPLIRPHVRKWETGAGTEGLRLRLASAGRFASARTRGVWQRGLAKSVREAG